MQDLDYKIDLIFDRMDDLLSAGKFKEVDDILLDLDISNFSITEILAYLSITLPAKNELRNREAYAKVAKDKIMQLDPVRADRLLKIYIK